MTNQDTPDTTRDARLEARVSAAQKGLLQQAAALSGRTLSEFVVASAQDAARRVIAEHESIRLLREEQLAFVQSLLNPPEPNARLKRAAKAYSPTHRPTHRHVAGGLERHHCRAPGSTATTETAFHCGVEELDRYLKQQARQDADKRVAAPFVAVRLPDTVVLGYYTLSASVLTLTDLPDELARKLPRYPQLPVTLLGRLAVDQSTKGQGLGEHLLLDALHRSLAHADQIAAMAVVVDAKDEAAAAFYRHYGFVTLQAQPNRLFVPMRLVAQLLG